MAGDGGSVGNGEGTGWEAAATPGGASPEPSRGGCRAACGVRGAAGCRSCHCLPSIKMFQAESKAPTGEIIITKNLAPAK